MDEIQQWTSLRRRHARNGRHCRSGRRPRHYFRIGTRSQLWQAELAGEPETDGRVPKRASRGALGNGSRLLHRPEGAVRPASRRTAETRPQHERRARTARLRFPPRAACRWPGSRLAPFGRGLALRKETGRLIGRVRDAVACAQNRRRRLVKAMLLRCLAKHHSSSEALGTARFVRFSKAAYQRAAPAGFQGPAGALPSRASRCAPWFCSVGGPACGDEQSGAAKAAGPARGDGTSIFTLVGDGVVVRAGCRAGRG